MNRALRLAVLARHASPNPAVGCVLVAPDGRIVGEGYTSPPGEGHAEANALLVAGEAARGAVAYVTLEPCCPFPGKRTPPCSEALIAAGVSAVKIAMLDPDPGVSGRGVARLQEAGIAVETGICEARARAFYAPYIKHRTTGLPWLVMKTGMSLDGKIAARTGDSKWITGDISRRAVHRQLRDRADAILTGIGTVLADDPALTTRLTHREGRNPLRIIVDSQCRTPVESQVVRLGLADGKTVIATTPGADSDRKDRLRVSGCTILECTPNGDGRVDLADLVRRLGTRGDILSVLVETGGELAAAMLAARLVDRWLAFIAPKIIGGQAAPGPIGGLGVSFVTESEIISFLSVRRSGCDLVIDAKVG